MSYAPIVACETAVGDLEWVFINGSVKKDLKGNPTYTANVVMSAEKAKPLMDQIDAYWDEHKPKGAKRKSSGYKDHTVKDMKASEEAGEPVYVETGKIMFTAKTGTSYKSGDEKIIKIFNVKGNEVSLQGKKIGNGSRGLLGLGLAMYDVNPSARGTTLYLNYIQISKFVEYAGGGTASGAIEDDEGGDGFDGVEGTLPQIEDGDDSQPEKPRL